MININYGILLVEGIVNIIFLLIILLHLEINLQLNWLVYEELNIISLGIVLILILFFIHQILLVTALVSEVTRRVNHPLLATYEGGLSLGLNLVLNLILFFLSYLYLRRYSVILSYQNGRWRLTWHKLPKIKK